MNQNGQNDLTSLVQSIFIVLIIIFAIIQVGSVLGLWNWVKPFFSVVWIVLKWSVLLGTMVVIVWFVTWVVKRERDKKYVQEQVTKGLTLHEGKWLTKTHLEEERKKMEEAEKKKQEELEKERKKEERNLRNNQKIKEMEEEEEEKGIKLELKLRYADDLKKLSPKDRELYINKKYRDIIANKNNFSNEQSNNTSGSSRLGDSLFNDVVSEIKKFKPARKYHDEFTYQVGLVEFLRSKFPNANIEQQKGSSRPDIVIDHIAIELKGPTKTIELQTIADKCMRYYQHFEELIIVLFEVEVNEQRYNEWKIGVNNTFPNVKIICK